VPRAYPAVIGFNGVGPGVPPVHGSFLPHRSRFASPSRPAYGGAAGARRGVRTGP